ncbi:GvpL/GvpF family gas vesicle protein [Leptolyngbya sp. PCC 6406]|uniref:gas vesicle protein GvpF n=1 Tax=Leptolyngbya sp. PCC 6406 TaxID=1173264 RepID=UPI0002ABC08A|nr:GvpL/GvpF family gas vesicle protein [Leptolyngbya sp. PCC 6406]
MTDSCFYLYGLFPAPGPGALEVQGLDGQAIQTHVIGDFAFLYSPTLQSRYLASRKHLLGHERVLEAAMTAGDRTLLPLQFGLIIEAWDQVVTDLLTPHGDSLKRLFTELEGKREVGVKVMWAADQELNQLMAEDAGLRQQRDRLEGKQLSMDEIVTIGQAIERGVQARKEAIIAAFQERLNPLASQVVENDPLTDTMIYNAAYLIPWDSEPQVAAEIEALDATFEDRLRIRYNNFTAPYNFAQLNQLN